MTEDRTNEPRGGPQGPELESWSEMLSRYSTHIAVTGAVLVLALILVLVFVVGSKGSGTPLRGQALQDAAGPAVTIPLPRPKPKVHSVHAATAASGSAASSPTTSTTATSATTVPAAASSVLASAGSPPSPPGPCAPADVTISTTTDLSSYSPGETVTTRTTLVDNVACVYDPTPSGAYGCTTTVLIDTVSGAQVYPVPRQAEQCGDAPGGTLEPGATRSVTFDWPQQAEVSSGTGPAPIGEYEAVGTWSWANGSAPPLVVTVDSPPFSVS